MYKIPAKTLFAGKNLVYVPQCHSTNTLAAELGQKVGTAEGTVVITDFQSAGRGQRGNSWESEPGQNLTFSLILRPTFLAARDQFKLNESVSVAIAEFAASLLDVPVHVKWPNDVLADDTKICGILVENHVVGEQLPYSIVGIGLNVNQSQFAAPRASSIAALSGRRYELDTLFADLLGAIEAAYLDLRTGNWSDISSRYEARLYKKDVPHTFASLDRHFMGIIRGVNKEGRLRVEDDHGEKVFGLKEIQYL